ncbi:hypothetical protein OF83DRAFT_13417 [Amylostereum chailletii]|nr:hypothetical protein OF83DRAFT_13417 [Amylostereum chailletii]
MPSQDELAAGHRFSTPEFSALDPEDFASIFNSNQDVSPEDSDLSFAQSFGNAVDPYVLDSVPSISDLPSLLSPSLSEASSLDSSSSLSSFASSSLCSPSATPEPFVFPLDHPFTFPSSLECVQDYTWLDCVLGPALGIQENVGSYKAYMDQQRSIYYEPLLETEAKQSVVAPDPPAPSTEYKSWLSSTKWNIPVPTPQIDKVELSLAQAVYSHCLSPEVLYGFSPYMEIHDQENQTMQHSPKQAVDSAPRTIDICPGELVSCQQSPMAPRKRRESLAFFDPNVIQDPSTATENVMTHERRPSEYMGSPRRHRKEGSRRSFINGGNSWHVRMRTCSGIYTL